MSEAETCGPTIGMEVAFLDKNMGFAYEGRMPWPYIKEDHQSYMNRCTSTVDPDKKNGILKGRLCWETMSDIDKCNPKTSIVVVSTTMKETPQNCHAVAPSYGEGMEMLLDGVKKGELENICVLGGKRIYEPAIEDPKVTYLQATRIFTDFPVDEFFPEFKHHFHLVSASDVHTDNGIKFQFETWKRNQ